MTVLTRWAPFREYSTLQDRTNRPLREAYNPEGPEEALTTTGFAPPVDIYEDEHNITLKIEVPGMNEKDIDVSIENNTLTVHGERKFEKEEKEEKGKTYHRIERKSGSIQRSITLPCKVQEDKIVAECKNGVLSVTIPKAEQAKTRKIPVKG